MTQTEWSNDVLQLVSCPEQWRIFAFIQNRGKLSWLIISVFLYFNIRSNIKWQTRVVLTSGIYQFWQSRIAEKFAWLARSATYITKAYFAMALIGSRLRPHVVHFNYMRGPNAQREVTRNSRKHVKSRTDWSSMTFSRRSDCMFVSGYFPGIFNAVSYFRRFPKYVILMQCFVETLRHRSLQSL